MDTILPYLPWIIGIVVVIVAIGLIAVGVTNSNQTDPLAERLSEYAAQTEAVANLEEIEMSVPFSQRVIMPIMQQIAKITTAFTPQQRLEKAAEQLTLAGNPPGLTPQIFYTMRLGAMIALGIVLLLLLSSGPAQAQLGSWSGVIGGVVGALIGFFMPEMWLSSKISKRQGAFIKALPDALDLMSICVEAGLGFDQAMGRVYDKWENELGLAFGRVLREIQLGKSRRDSLKALDESVQVSDLTTFCSAIIQADQLGVSISKVLKIQSEQMRVKRRQRAQEKAQQAPIKMMIPMVLLIFPSIWLVLLGPAAIMIYKLQTKQ